LLGEFGLGHRVDARPVELSGGEQARAAFALALARGTRLVIADEPTANLDSTTGAQIIELMRRVQAESRTTFVFATHDPQLMSQADEIFAIRDGVIVERRHGRNGS
jgi:putative ABC transport system ATP-binding protein